MVGFFLICNLADCSSWIYKSTAANQNGEFIDPFLGGLKGQINSEWIYEIIFQPDSNGRPKLNVEQMKWIAENL